MDLMDPVCWIPTVHDPIRCVSWSHPRLGFRAEAPAGPSAAAAPASTRADASTACTRPTAPPEACLTFPVRATMAHHTCGIPKAAAPPSKLQLQLGSRDPPVARRRGRSMVGARWPRTRVGLAGLPAQIATDIDPAPPPPATSCMSLTMLTGVSSATTMASALARTRPSCAKLPNLTTYYKRVNLTTSVGFQLAAYKDKGGEAGSTSGTTNSVLMLAPVVQVAVFGRATYVIGL